MGFKEIKVQEEVAANLVPMIDIMFLLLLFFMLNADMSQRDLEDIKPPTANKADQDKPEENSNRITVNVHHSAPDCAQYAMASDICIDSKHWFISLQGNRYALTEAELAALQKRLSALADANRVKPGDKTSKSERFVLIRGDHLAPYGLIQRSLERIAGAGLYKTQVAVEIEKSSLAK
jgi:biopolymer transport protein ExbD